MDARRLIISGWRAALLVALIVIALGAFALGRPGDANAGAYNCSAPAAKGAVGCPPQKQAEVPLAPLSYTGWTYLNLNYCAPGKLCTLAYAVSTPAFKWTGKTWGNAALPGGWVYVSPFGGGFRWAWSQQTGWLAVSGNRFEIRAH